MLWTTRHPARSRPLLVALLMIAAAASAPTLHAQQPADAAKPADPEHARNMAAGIKLFQEQVRGILLNNCVTCHGKDHLKSDLDLATRQSLLRGGEQGPAIVPGKPYDSLLIKLIRHDRQPHMPHKRDRLADADIAAVARWIELGAPYDKPLVDTAGRDFGGPMQVTDKDRQFWSFQPLHRAEPPPVKNEAWLRNDVDRFVLATLEEKGLTPNAPAERRVLIRRAYLDLIGMPPTPEQVDTFVNDTSPNAWEQVIDTLLASPHYGERWGRYWLDVARFAESFGFEQDYDRPHAYHYRDFVIKALNADMPYDQFVRWQIAGDELAPDEPLAWMATGFLGAGVFPTQLTEKEFESARYDELDDMASTVGTAMLGMTIGCARCHDHKFDPIPVTDYYRFISTFTTTIRSNIELELEPEKHQRELAEWRKQHEPLAAELGKYEREQLPARFEQWLAARKPGDADAQRWVVLNFTEAKSHGGATFTKQPDGSLLASGTNPDFDTYTFVADTKLSGITAIRLEALAHESMVKGGPGRAGNGNMGVGTFRVTAAPLAGGAEPVPVKLVNPKATFEQNNGNLSIAATIDDQPNTGWAVDPQFGKDHAAVFETAEDIAFDGGATLTFTIEFKVNNKHNIGRPRLAVTTAPRPVGLEGDARPQPVVEALAKLDGGAELASLTEAQRAALLDWYKLNDAEWTALNAKVQRHLAAKPKPQKTQVMVASESVKPIPHHADGRGFPHFYKQTYLLNRGDVNQKQGEVEQGFLRVLMRNDKSADAWKDEPPADAKTSHRRAALADWITDTRHGAGHLLARVMANRLWQHHLGRGIVGTPNDFGLQGDRPTHPQLLDWLATELIARNWRLKPMHKLIMTSAAYMQGSAHDDADFTIDPENRFYWRYEPRRLEAEAIRDSMLAVSGELDDTMFGPGTLDENHKRRSIYFFIKRSRLIPTLVLFDMPEPLASQGRRPATTIAPQALYFMNNPQVRTYAAGFAQRIKPAAQQSYEAAVTQAYRIALGRAPDADELASNAAFIREQYDSYGGRGDALDKALADFCQVVMSLNEFLYIE